MKVYVIASTEYRANMPDLFLMDEQGNYYGVSPYSYVHHYNYPPSVKFWIQSTCADSDRFFIIEKVDLSPEQVNEFDAVTKEYTRLESFETPRFEGEWPNRADYKTEKEYQKAYDDCVKAYKEWGEKSGATEITIKRNELWSRRTRLFLTFSENVYNGIKNNDNIKYL